MITILFENDNKGRLKRFKVNGHDAAAKKGESVICAAVSALALTFVKSVGVILEVPLYGTVTSGKIDLSVREIAGDKQASLDLLLKSFKIGLNSIIEEYGNVIEIIEQKL